MTPFTLIPDIDAAITEIAPDSIVSRTVIISPTLRVILFGFAAGQELSEHTSTKEAVLHFLHGAATVTLGQESFAVAPGAVIRMEPNLPHSVHADTETIMLLYMFGR